MVFSDEIRLFLLQQLIVGLSYNRNDSLTLVRGRKSKTLRPFLQQKINDDKNFIAKGIDKDQNNLLKFQSKKMSFNDE